MTDNQSFIENVVADLVVASFAFCAATVPGAGKWVLVPASMGYWFGS